MLNCGFDFAFLPLETDAPLPTPVERLRSTIVPLKASGPSSPSSWPGNSTVVTSPAPDGVKSPVCGAPVPASGIWLPLVLAVDVPTVQTAAIAATASTSPSDRNENLRIPLP